MATNTYVALDKVTVATATPSITFSSIPQTYTDLVLVFNARSDRNDQANRPTDLIKVTYNGSNASNYSDTVLGSNSTSTPFSYRETNQAFMAVGAIPGAQSNAGEFGVNTFHIMSYSNTTTYKTLLARGGNATSVGSGNYYMGAMVGLWRGATGSSTEAITSITLAPYVGPNFVAGSTFSLYGIKAEAIVTAKATGGTINYAADGYTYHTFTSSGTFTPLQALTCDYLVVAGGGGGGSSDYIMAGGGAGGLRSTVGATGGGGTLEPQISLGSGIGYTIQVGAGGPGNANGVNSFISGSGLTTITSIGGGYGAGPAPRGTVAQSGGSGGGGCESVSARGTGGAGTANQGYAGGNYTSNTHTRQAGGGGAGAVGQNSGTSTGGGGGNGVQITAFANATLTGANSGYYAGGGGGGEWGGSGNASGGLGGGAAGAPMSTSTGPSGVANTGGGGGGGANNGGTGGNGGSGIVIIRYASV